MCAATVAWAGSSRWPSVSLRSASTPIDPAGLARFWAGALGWTIEDDATASSCSCPSDESGVPIRFVPGAAPKVGQNRNHLDLTTTSLDDQRDTVEQLLALGGAHVDIGQTADEDHVVLADPEGNELCVLAPGNRFLAGCGRLGASTATARARPAGSGVEVLGWPLVWDEDEETARAGAARADRHAGAVRR